MFPVTLDQAMWIVTAGSLIGTTLNIKRSRWCFPIWLVTNILWTIYNVIKNVPSEAGLSAAYVGLAIWGIWEWGR